MAPSMSSRDAGGVLVLLATTAMSVALAAPAQEAVSLSVSPPEIIIHGADPGDALGALGLATGDLSGDGVPDLAVAATSADGPINTLTSAGEVHVVFGPIAGARDLRAQPGDVVVYGRDLGGSLGWSLAVGDLNGDGRDDLVVGHPESRRPNDRQRGEVCVLFGPLAPGSVDLAVTEPDLCIVAARDGQSLGASVTIADVSGDGRADLVAGARSMSSAAGSFVGGLVAVFGPLTPGPTRFLEMVPADLVVLGRHPRSYLGSSVAVGDLTSQMSPDANPDPPLDPTCYLYQ